MPLQYSFDVETRQGSRWVFDSIREREFLARKRADELLANPSCPGVRIIRTWSRPDGVHVDTEIFCLEREFKGEDRLRIAPLESIAANCHSLKDFFGYESRQAMARIFRTYLAKFVLTPTEILHNLRHLKRIGETDALVRSAVEMVATLQTREGAQDSGARRTEIYTAIDAMVERAQGLDAAALPKLDRAFGEVMASLDGGLDSDQRQYLMLAALSRDLGKLPGWLSKLDVLCTMAIAENQPEALEMLDGVIADVLGTDVIEEFLGIQHSLRKTICALLDLADGIAPAPAPDAIAVAAKLCDLLSRGQLPTSRRSIIERAHRAIRLPGPLRPNDFEQEPEEFHAIIARVLTPAGLLSGPETAHALTTRFARRVEQGGKSGRRTAIKGVFEAMPDHAYGVIFLCDLGRSALARDHLADMAALFRPVLRADTLRDFCESGLAPHARMARATAAHRAMAAGPFPADLRAGVVEYIDDLLARFVVAEAIIDKLDRPDLALRERAERLVRFCQSGLLPEGKALKVAQERVLSLLKQADFPTRFVEGIDDPLAAQAALRDFFVLLKGSGMHRG